MRPDPPSRLCRNTEQKARLLAVAGLRSIVYVVRRLSDQNGVHTVAVLEASHCLHMEVTRIDFPLSPARHHYDAQDSGAKTGGSGAYNAKSTVWSFFL